MSSTVQHDTQAGKFFLSDKPDAHLLYERRGTLLDLQHTYVPASYRGQGLAEKLVDEAFAVAEREGLKVVPTCSYIHTYLSRKPEAKKLVASTP
eukprot:tig00001126_g7129.t1